MENLLSKVGKTIIKASVKMLAVVCTGILSVIETADRTGKKGGN